MAASYALHALGEADISTLVSLSNVQFASNDVMTSYADAVNLQSLNLTIESCDDDFYLNRLRPASVIGYLRSCCLVTSNERGFGSATGIAFG